MRTADIPHPPGRLPLLGDVRGVSPHRPVQDSMRLARELGPIYSRRVLGQDIVIVSGAELVADLADESRFSKHVGLGIRSLRDVAGDGLFTAYNNEPNWRTAHVVLHSSFAASALRGYHSTMVGAVRDLVRSWDSRLGRPIDVAESMTQFTLETIGRAGFGYSFDSFQRTELHPFVAAMVRALDHSKRRGPVPPWIPNLPDRGRHAADIALMHRTVDDVIAARRADRSRSASDSAPADLLDAMLRSPDPATGKLLDPVNIRFQVITFLVAGHETTSGALSFALHYLVQNPAIMARARAEVDSIWGDGQEVDPSYEQVTKLRYVRRVIDEALRLWPTAPAYARRAKASTRLAGKYPMERGDRALVLLPMLHRDPVWGSDVESFDPDRFLPERIRQRPPHSYKPFGTGERACIGRQFALHEAVLALGTLLRRYELAPPPGPAYQLRMQELLTIKPAGLTLIARARKPAQRTSDDRGDLPVG